MKKFFAEFKEFAVRGNAVSMAVGIVIGGAFNQIVQAIVTTVIDPILGLFANDNLSQLSFSIGGVTFYYGTLLSVIINFILTAFVLFLIVKAMNRFDRKKEEAPAAPAVKVCPYCRTEIPLEAVRCPHCTSQLEP